MIDQMFRQEIKNAEIIKDRWFLSKCCRSNRLLDYNEASRYNENICWRIWNKITCASEPLIDPEKLNPFLQELIDPFRVKENKKYEKHFLETLWYQAHENEWLSKRQEKDYYKKKIKKASRKNRNIFNGFLNSNNTDSSSDSDSDIDSDENEINKNNKNNKNIKINIKSIKKNNNKKSDTDSDIELGSSKKNNNTRIFNNMSYDNFRGQI